MNRGAFTSLGLFSNIQWVFHTNGIGFKECQWIYGSKYLLRSYKRPPDITRQMLLPRTVRCEKNPMGILGDRSFPHDIPMICPFSHQDFPWRGRLRNLMYLGDKASIKLGKPSSLGGLTCINWIRLACSISGWVFTQWLLPVTSKPNVTLLKCWTMLTQRRRFPIVFFPSKPMG